MNAEKIMVVEDEWVVAKQICKNLKDFGYTVCSTASTGDEAIRNVEADRPDLILMDIVLKGNMDGHPPRQFWNEIPLLPTWLFTIAHSRAKGRVSLSGWPIVTNQRMWPNLSINTDWRDKAAPAGYVKRWA